MSENQKRSAGSERTCRGCGCTDDRACIGAGGVPCHWVEEDLCSVCRESESKKQSKIVNSK